MCSFPQSRSNTTWLKAVEKKCKEQATKCDVNLAGQTLLHNAYVVAYMQLWFMLDIDTLTIEMFYFRHSRNTFNARQQRFSRPHWSRLGHKCSGGFKTCKSLDEAQDNRHLRQNQTKYQLTKYVHDVTQLSSNNKKHTYSKENTGFPSSGPSLQAMTTCKDRANPC